MAKAKRPDEIKKKFIKSLTATADLLEKDPTEITKTQFIVNDEVGVSEWDLRTLGGFQSLKTLLFPDEMANLKEITGSRLVKSFRKKLETKKAVDEYLADEFLAVFKEHLNNEPLVLHKAVKPPVKGSKKERAVVVHVSDTHFGANIDSDEMGLVNKFNWQIAARRLALFAEQVVDYKPQYRKETELVICINGDIIAGVIHNQEWFSDLLTKQFNGTISLLLQFITYCAKHYPSTRVVCTTGNHGRAMHKESKSRANTHKWDSYETMIYVAIREALHRSHKNIKVEVPKTPYAIIDVLGHKGFVTHGDTVINVGNPGRSINMKSINTQINSLNSSELTKDKFEFIMCGHVHVCTLQITDSGTVMIINGTLSGSDPFCQSIGIFGNEPTQQLFEVTKEHAVGDVRFIRLRAADDRADLENIIVPPTSDI